jgi:hypothetical protein
LDPHTLSQVLSGALCKVLVEIYDHLKQEEVGKATTVAESRKAWGKALSRASVRFKRMAFRALDFLPPGEVSFADYGRALIAADQVAYPADDKMRQAVRRQFVGRSMVESEVALQMDGHFDYGPLTLIEIDALCDSDWVAYQFANANRELLRIPKHIPFEVRPRVRVLKRYDGDRRGEPSGEECIFKVTWSENEDNAGGARLPAQRQIPVGCTLVVHPQTRRVLCRLTSATPPDRPRVGEDRKVRRLRLAERRQQRKDRDGFLRNLVDEGVLRLGVHGLAPDGQPLLSAVRGEVTGEVMRLRGSGNLLHIMRGGESGGHSG